MTRYDGLPADLIPVLQDIQDSYNYLPKDELKVVAERLNVPLTQIYSVATFYKGFSLNPKGKHHIAVCTGSSCHLHGGQLLLESVSRRLDVESGEATADLQLSLEKVKCLGQCNQAPLMKIDQDYHFKVQIDRLTKLLKPYRKPK